MLSNISTDDILGFSNCADGGLLILSNDSALSIHFASQSFKNLVGLDSPNSLLDFVSSSNKSLLINEIESNVVDFHIECNLSIKGDKLCSVLLKFHRASGKLYCMLLLQKSLQQCIKQLEFEQTRHLSLIEMSGSLMAEFDVSGNLTYTTSSLQEALNFSYDGVDLKSYLLYSGFVKSDSFTPLLELLRFKYETGKVIVKELELQTKMGYRWFSVTLRGVLSKTGDLLRVVGKLEDIDFYKRKVSSISMKAISDELTGCYKKGYLLEQLLGKTLGTNSFLLFFDVDNFKGVNDTYGHLNGDKALIEIAKSANMAFADYNSIVCRFGGDEYCIFVHDISEDELRQQINLFRVSVRSIVIDGHRPLSISIGISQGGIGSNINCLMSESDLALYYTKEHGKDGFCFYNEVRDSFKTTDSETEV